MIQSNNPFISIIIPAYNEAERIGATLQSVDTFMRTKHYLYEIVVVNDGSTDATAALINEFAKTIPHLRLIDNKENQGKGGVIQQGMLEANGRVSSFYGRRWFYFH
jgi:dolichyl-phosphate beta-glucosyltransferase